MTSNNIVKNKIFVTILNFEQESRIFSPSFSPNSLIQPYLCAQVRSVFYEPRIPILCCYFQVISLLLMITPFIVKGTNIMHCLAAAPTLVMSVMFVVLYLVDQVHDLAEQLYLTMQIICCLLAFSAAFLMHSPSGALYGLFYCHLIIALVIDMYYVIKERGYAPLRKDDL